MSRPDHELLSAWARERSEESFRSLVDRYAGLVYGTAMRRTDDARLAEEVAQDVFGVLARKAGRLDGRGGIGGWLFKTTVLAAAAVRRSEGRRERSMRDFKDIEESLRHPGHRVSGETAELIDDGLAALRANDREVLVQRFYNGLSFREIAQASGRSEAACRKHAGRALEKLSEALGRSGAKVSSAALATGLTGLLSTKAPAGLAASLATSALAAAPAAAGTGIISTILTAMITSKMTGIIVVGGLLLLASTGTSYVIGRERAKTAAAAGGGGKAPVLAAAVSSKGSERGNKGSRDAAASRAGAPAGENTVAAIVDRLKDAVRGRDWVRVRDAGRPIVSALQGPDMEEAFEMIAGEQGELRQKLASVLYERWGALDGKTALDRIMEEDDEKLRRIVSPLAIEAWAAVDPEEAFAWHQELASRKELPISEMSVDYLLGSVLQAWGRKDMNAAWDTFERLSPDRQHATLRRLTSLIDDPEHREATAKRVALVADEALRAKLAKEVGEDWAELDPVAAVKWFDTVEIEDPMLRLRVAMEMAEGWFETEPRAAADWIWPQVPEGMRDRLAENMAESPFGQESWAAEWFEARGYDLKQLQEDD